MLRYIKIGGQITEGSEDFAFYDTITDRFIEFGGVQVFENWNDFLECFEERTQFPLDRFARLAGVELPQ